MKKAKFILVILVLATPALISGGYVQAQKREPIKVSDLMKRKLEHAQKVLEGIALNDFDKIAKQGDELMLVSKQAEWKVLKTPQYELWSNDFRRNVESLVQNAKGKNLDGATLAYMEMTMSCVKCHKYVRETRTTRLNIDQKAIAALTR